MFAAIKSYKYGETLLNGETLLKGAKVFWTAVEITDTTMDAGQLADDLARHFMGDKYDPKAKRLYDEVCVAGLEYDKTLQKVQVASSNINNLIEGIRVVSLIHLDYGDQQKIVFVQLDKLDKLKGKLQQRTPTAFTWFETIGTIAKTKEQESDTDRLRPITPSDPWWMYTLRGLGLGIEMQATYASYNEYKKKKKSSGDDAEVDDTLKRRRRNAQADIFSGIDPEDVKTLRETHTSKLKKVRSGLSTLGASLSWGLKKVATGGSFAMNVYTIVNKVKAHQEAVRSLNENIERYKNDKIIYEYILNGVPEDSLQRVKDFFDQESEVKDSQIDITSEESKQALRDGFYKQIEKCNKSIKGGDNDKGEYEPGILDCMSDAYDSLISQFENAARKDERNDQISIKNLKESKDTFNGHRTVAEDATKNGAIRKNSLDVIAEEFSGSVAKQLSLILSRLNIAIADHSSFNQLVMFAELLLKEQKKIDQEKAVFEENLNRKQRRKADKARALAEETDDDDRKDLQEDIQELDEEIAELELKIAEQMSKFDAELDKQADFALNLLNKQEGGKYREKLRDLDEVKEALRKQMNDLQNPAVIN